MTTTPREAMTRLVIDFENPCPTWWEGGGTELWEGIREGFDGNDALVERALADSWLQAAATIEGWNDGPEYAPHPIRIKPIDEDEEL